MPYLIAIRFMLFVQMFHFSLKLKKKSSILWSRVIWIGFCIKGQLIMKKWLEIVKLLMDWRNLDRLKNCKFTISSIWSYKKIEEFMVIKFLSILHSRYFLIYNYIAKFLFVQNIIFCFLQQNDVLWVIYEWVIDKYM